jgi:hypothetical protein
MPRQVICRLLLVCAVLLAQQTALAHDFWHATSPQSSGETQKLCDLHDLLGTVLGALSAASVPHDLLSLADPGFAAAPALAAGQRPLSPHSRDPPLIS